jgi:hypothetical protein
MMLPPHVRDRWQAGEGWATEAATLATLATPPLPTSWRTQLTRGTTPRGAIGQPEATPATTTRGPPQWAEVLIEAEGMPEAEATAESEAAATIWEVNLAEGGGGHGAAGSEATQAIHPMKT